MLAQNLFQLYKTFDKKDLKNFSRFLKSPYFNQNCKITQLFGEIIKYYPNFNSKKLSSEILYGVIYKSKYNDSTMRNLFFRLLKQTEKFLILENISKNKFLQINFLLNEFNNRRQKSFFIKSNKSISELVKNIDVMNFDFYFNKYFREVNNYNFYCIHENLTNKKAIDKQIHYLNKASTKLIVFCITELVCNFLTGQYFNNSFQINKNIGLDILENINLKGISSIVDKKEEDLFILLLYESLLNAFRHIECDEYYFAYKKNVQQFMKNLTKDESSFHYSKLIDYCVLKQRIKKSNFDSKGELFFLYNELLENEYYKNNKVDEMPQNLFRAILLNAISLKKFDWMKSFIEKYSKEVEARHRENMYKYGLAFYYYEMNDLNLSLECASEISLDYFIYKYDIKSLFMRIYYDLEKTEDALDLIHNFKEHLRIDENLNPYTKVIHKNFLKYYEKLLQYKSGRQRIDIEYLREKIKKSDQLILKNWLMDRYDKMIEIKTRKEQVLLS